MLSLVDEPEPALECTSCHIVAPADAIVPIKILATVDGHDSKHTGSFCLMCWDKLEQGLVHKPQASATGAVWQQ